VRYVDAAFELLRARSKLFAFNSNNAVLQFLLDVIIFPFFDILLLSVDTCFVMSSHLCLLQRYLLSCSVASSDSFMACMKPCWITQCFFALL